MSMDFLGWARYVPGIQKVWKGVAGQVGTHAVRLDGLLGRWLGAMAPVCLPSVLSLCAMWCGVLMHAVLCCVAGYRCLVRT